MTLWRSDGRYRDELELEAARWLMSRGLGAPATPASRAVTRALERLYYKRNGRPLRGP